MADLLTSNNEPTFAIADTWLDTLRVHKSLAHCARSEWELQPMDLPRHCGRGSRCYRLSAVGGIGGSENSDPVSATVEGVERSVSSESRPAWRKRCWLAHGAQGETALAAEQVPHFPRPDVARLFPLHVPRPAESGLVPEVHLNIGIEQASKAVLRIRFRVR